MTAKMTHNLADTLQALSAGDRCWFWLCTTAPGTPLMVERFSDPEGMDRLVEQASAARLPPGASSSTGMMAVADDGALQFGGPALDHEALAALAGWVKANLSDFPALARLSGARFHQLSPAGRAVATHEAPALWDGIRRPAVAGSLPAAAEALGALEAGQPAWIWMTEGAHAPVVVALPVAEDPSAEQLSGLILSGRSRAGGAGPGLRGTVQRLQGGGLLVISSDPLDRVGAKLSDWLGALGEVRLVQTSGDEIVDSRRLGAAPAGAPDLSAEARALAAVADGTPQWFWFTSASGAGAPRLLLGDSPAALKPRALEVGSTGVTVRGQLVAARWGLEVRCRKAPGDFLRMLAGWVSDNHARCPALLGLVDARMTIRDRDNQIVARHKDTNTWADLRALRS